MGLRLKTRAAIKPVTNTEEDIKTMEAFPKGPGYRVKRSYSNKPLPGAKVLEVVETQETIPEENIQDLTVEEAKKIRNAGKLKKSNRPEDPELEVLTDNDADYVRVDLKGSNGKEYKVVIPKGYIHKVPLKWKWDTRKYKIADAIAAGFPMTQISKMYDVPRPVIYAWLQHPEFKDHVDGIVLESGWANQRERIAGLNKITRLLFDKVVGEISKIKLTDKSIGPVLSAIQLIAKQIGQEKGEFIEQTKVEQSTNISGAIGVGSFDIEAFMENKTDAEKALLEAEFNKVGNDVIRNITGDK
jgi:hypothetical protein